MARLGFTFDSSNQQGQDTNDVLPAGDYIMQVVQSEVRATKDGSGQYVWIEFDILDGEHQGRKYWDRLNIWNANPTAAEIANRALTSLTRACGLVAIEDTEELHFKPIKVRMGVSKRKDTGELQNRATYLPLQEGGAPQAPARAPAAPAAGRPAPTASAGAKAPPWAAHRK
jgi:hypothetical protein